MRTTVTLDPDVDRLVKESMRKRAISSKEALNEAVRMRSMMRKSAGNSVVQTIVVGINLLMYAVNENALLHQQTKVWLSLI